jgi:asparagine N-glycosylation enzyme membrane subunit Stt3
LSRFYYDDANGLQNFRLIYEDGGDYLVMARCITVKPAKPSNEILRFNNYEAALKSVKSINDAGFASMKSANIVLPKVKIAPFSEESTTFAYNARPPVKGVKIFEKVAGAIILGNAAGTADNTPVEILLKLTTRYGRSFVYKQVTTTKNGKYQFTVPYSTDEMIGDGYDYDVRAVSLYNIKLKNRISQVAVSEKAIMLGETIKGT